VTNVAGVSICDRACIIVKLSSVTRRCYACVEARHPSSVCIRDTCFHPFALIASIARSARDSDLRREFGNGARMRASARIIPSVARQEDSRGYSLSCCSPVTTTSLPRGPRSLVSRTFSLPFAGQR